MKQFETYLNNVEIIIVNQENNKKFNRGKLLNIGFKERLNSNFIFTHDVDLIPEEELIKNVYTVEKFDALRIFSAHDSSLGGICKFSSESFLKCNGFPNHIWGWGIEDRALYNRYIFNKFSISQNNHDDYKRLIQELPHIKSNEIYTGEKKKISEEENYIFSKKNENLKINHIKKSGLNNLKYSLIKSETIKNNIRFLSVDI
jgi:hypothetical protein